MLLFMKKIILMAATAAVALSCAQEKAPKVLVLYYSQSSNTQKVAQEIGSRLGADMEAIVPVEPYDGTYQETIERSMKEREAGVLPEIQPLTADIKDYDIIFIGYPIWFGTFAPPMGSLLEKVDFSGKKLVPAPGISRRNSLAQRYFRAMASGPPASTQCRRKWTAS